LSSGERRKAGKDKGRGAGDAGQVRTSAETKVTITYKCYRKVNADHMPPCRALAERTYDAEETMMP
jgi:hypothetical protein